MQTITKQYQVFSFDELSPAAQNTAIDDHINFLHETADLSCEVDQLKECLELFGFYDVKIFYSGFCCQGDGASFSASYRYKKGGLNAVKKEYAGTYYQELIEYLELIQKIAQKTFYRIYVKIEQRGRYYHENTMNITSIDDINGNRDFYTHESDFLEYARGIAQRIYRMLESDYHGQTCRKSAIESIKLNEYNFFENGKLFS